jgi:hypothetical protein
MSMSVKHVLVHFHATWRWTWALTWMWTDMDMDMDTDTDTDMDTDMKIDMDRNIIRSFQKIKKAYSMELVLALSNKKLKVLALLSYKPKLKPYKKRVSSASNSERLGAFDARLWLQPTSNVDEIA